MTAETCRRIDWLYTASVRLTERAEMRRAVGRYTEATRSYKASLRLQRLAYTLLICDLSSREVNRYAKLCEQRREPKRIRLDRIFHQLPPATPDMLAVESPSVGHHVRRYLADPDLESVNTASEESAL